MDAPRYSPLLAHHAADQLDRCVVVPWPGGGQLVCARCLGAFAGLAASLAAWLLGHGVMPPLVGLLALPDWLLAAVAGWRGANIVRLASGALLGGLCFRNWLQLLTWRWESQLILVDGVMLVAFAVGLVAMLGRTARPGGGDVESEVVPSCHRSCHSLTLFPSSHGDDLMASQWYYAKGGEQHGPVSGQELKGLAATGGLGPADLVWKEGMPEWRPAAGLQGLFPATQPGAAPSKAPAEKPIVLAAPPAPPPQAEGVGHPAARQAGLFDMARSFSQKATEAVAKVQVKVEAYQKETQQQFARKTGQLDSQPRGSLLEVLRAEVARYEGWGTPTGDWLAEKGRALVKEVELSGAETAEQHRARMVESAQPDERLR